MGNGFHGNRVAVRQPGEVAKSPTHKKTEEGETVKRRETYIKPMSNARGVVWLVVGLALIVGAGYLGEIIWQ